ncbi:MAG: hypothetical protein HY215_03790 [Candidatus Rokubacteria bacterium]|nr:hypothetical protein [Candidatus Rokubacteria bacterium]
MKRSQSVLLLLLLTMAGSPGCAALALTVFGTGAGISASTSSNYLLDSIVYKTFIVPEQGLRKVTLVTLKRMAIKVKENQATEAGTKIVGVAGDRTIEVELDRLTARTTRMRVTVKRGWFFRDRATATEIIVQTERTLDDQPTLARAAMPTTTARAAQK